MLWPDEVYQTTEQGHRLAFGYGFTPWEFTEGLRSWALPAGLGAVMRSASALGADSGLAVMTAVKLTLALGGVAAVAAAMLLAWRLGGPTASLLAGGLTVAFPMLLVYGHHAFAETVSAPLVVAAAALALGTRRSSHAAAGVLAAVATVIRPQNAIVAVGVVVLLLVRRNREGARRYVLAAGSVAALAGAADWVAWGAPFASFWRYVDFNLVEGGSLAFGTSPPGYYLRHLLSSSGPAVLLVAAGLVVAVRRAPVLLATLGAYVVLHSVVGHKELRFLLPVVPLALALAGVGLGRVVDGAYARLADRGGRPAVWSRPGVLAAAMLLPAAFAFSAGYETLGRLGEHRAELSQTSPWHHVESWNRLLSTAGERPSLCGVAVSPMHIVFTGGYSYLHRDVPMFNANQYALREGEPPDRGANHLVAPTDYPVPAGFREVAREGPTRLLARPGGCDAPPPTYRRAWPRPPEVLQLR
jgi:GPI mannosyltransferase 3